MGKEVNGVSRSRFEVSRASTFADSRRCTFGVVVKRRQDKGLHFYCGCFYVGKKGKRENCADGEAVDAASAVGVWD